MKDKIEAVLKNINLNHHERVRELILLYEQTATPEPEKIEHIELSHGLRLMLDNELWELHYAGKGGEVRLVNYDFNNFIKPIIEGWKENGEPEPEKTLYIEVDEDGPVFIADTPPDKKCSNRGTYYSSPPRNALCKVLDYASLNLPPGQLYECTLKKIEL